MREQRRQRLAQIIRKAVAQRLQELTHTTEATITDVFLSPDFAIATVWVSVLHPDLTHQQAVMAEIASIRHELQSEVASSLSTRRTPRLEFKLDNRTAEINQLLAQIDHDLDPKP